jgi:uncharacterized protein (TIGR03084 family)
MASDAHGIVAALGEQHDELAGILAELTDADWARPTRCDGWVVSDVVLHLAQTDEMAIGSLEGRYGEAVDELVAGSAVTTMGNVDDGAAAMVAAQRGLPPTAIRDRWLKASGTVRSLAGAADGHKRVVWVTGELSVTTLTATRLAECWIHSGDVADAVGVELEPADGLRHIARLAWRTLPYAFERYGRQLSGPVAFELTGPRGEAWDFVPDHDPVTVIRGDGVELCMVAGRRLDSTESSLKGHGPDAEAVLELVRTYA